MFVKSFINKSKFSFSTLQTQIKPDRFINYFLKPGYYSYTDNTQFIEKIFDNNFNELILCPQNYGKTFNMETFKYFISCNQLIDERVDKNMRLDFFKSTSIYQSSLFNEHFSKYPVILINFKELDQNNFKDNIEKFRFLVGLQFEQVLQFLQIKEYKDNLTSIDVKNIEDFFSNFRNFNEQTMINSCKDLGKILLKITKQNPFMIVEDYDFPLLHSFKKGYYSDMLSFMQSFVGTNIKNNNFLNKTLITGTNLAEQRGLFSQVNNLKIYNYDDKVNNKYYDYFSSQNSQVDVNNSVEELNLKHLLNSLINENNASSTSGMKVIADLKMKSDYILNGEKEEDIRKPIKVETGSIDFSNYVTNKFSPTETYTYLYYNGLIDLNGQIRDKTAAEMIKEALPNLENPQELNYDFNRKLSYAYYTYFSNRKIEDFLEYLKNLFIFVSKAMKNKNAAALNLLPDFNFVFRNEKELESYLIDTFTLDLSNENKEDIRIFSIDDDENSKISEELKQFSLITYDKLGFAVFLKGNKYKKLEKKAASVEETKPKFEIDELMNNPNINLNPLPSKSTKKPFGGFVKTSSNSTIDLPLELRKINEHSLSEINKQEAINFLMKISPDYDTVYFIAVSNYQKQIDYILDIIHLEKE